MKLHYTLFFFFLWMTAGLAQNNYPEDVFQSPLNIPLVLSGTFGELRSNHFHSGLDIKTQQREGLSVFAIGDGVITRIKISRWGYGKALYVAHPNGYTSVYGHLQKFAPEIEAYVKKHQYAKRSFEIELFPKNGELSCTKGQVIAYSGNTGGSGGPHLHFEIRGSASQKPINPMYFGIDIKDTQAPVLQRLFAYPLGSNAQVNKSERRIQIPFRRTQDGNYKSDPVYASGRIGFGFNGYDRQDLAYNHNGVYAVALRVNNKTVLQYDFESFAFSETRYINTFIDYEYFIKNRSRIQKCFVEAANPLSIYQININNGVVEILPGKAYQLELKVRDFSGNTSSLFIPVIGKKQEVVYFKDEARTDYFIKASQPNNFDLGAAKVHFPAKAFYQDFYIDLVPGKDTVKIHNKKVPVHKNFTVTFNASQRSTQDREKLYIALLDKKGNPTYQNTYKRNGHLSTRTRNLGTYTLVSDTTPPRIRPRNFKDHKWLSNYRYLSLKLEDHESGIDSYSATINGEWVLLEYDAKKGNLKYDFKDKVFDDTRLELEVKAIDNVGNSTTFTSTLFRKK